MKKTLSVFLTLCLMLGVFGGFAAGEGEAVEINIFGIGDFGGGLDDSGKPNGNPGGARIVGKGQLVVNEGGGLCYQVEGPVGIGLRKRVAALRKATAKVGKRSRCHNGILSIDRARKAQAQALVVLGMWVKCQPWSSLLVARPPW